MNIDAHKIAPKVPVACENSLDKATLFAWLREAGIEPERGRDATRDARRDRRAEARSDGSFVLELDSGGTTAFLRIVPPVGLGRPVVLNAVLADLDARGWKGIRQDRNLALALAAYPPSAALGWPVLASLPPTSGEDGKIEWRHGGSDEKASVRSEEDENGNVHWHTPMRSGAVPAGAVVGRIIPPGIGRSGRTIDGHEIPARTGRPIEVDIGEGIRIEGDRILSVTAGNLVQVPIPDPKGPRFRISLVKSFTIRNDVGIESGDVDCDGDVEIQGSVLPGSSVRAGGGIRITGSVESASLTACNGDIEVGSGIRGENASVCASGSVRADFIEGAQVKAGADVVVRRALLHAKVCAEGEVVVSKKPSGTIRGGRTYAGNGIHAAILGGAAETPTFLHAGNPRAAREAEEESLRLPERVAEDRALLFRFLQRMESSVPVAHAEEIRMHLENEIASLLRAIERSKEKGEEALGRAESSSFSRITASVGVHAGSILRIGRFALAIRIGTGPGTWRIDRETHEVRLTHERATTPPII